MFSPPLFLARGSGRRTGALELEKPALPFSIDKQITETRLQQLLLNDLVLKKLRLKALELEKLRMKGHSCKNSYFLRSKGLEGSQYYQMSGNFCVCIF